MTAKAATHNLGGSFKKWDWVGWFVVIALTAVLYAHVLSGLGQTFWDEPRSSQGLLVIPLAAYLGWTRKDELKAEPARPHWSGLIVVFVAITFYLVGTVAAELFLPRLSFFLLIAGVLMAAGGLRWLRIFAFPLLLAATSIPLPALLYNRLSGSLQLLASDVAARACQTAGIVVFQDGNVIHLPRIVFGIEEACSGLTALSSLLVTSLLIGSVMTLRPWPRIVIALAAIPLAVAINVVRVAGTAVFATYNRSIALGFYHSFSGWLVFVFGLGALYSIARTTDSLCARLWHRRNI